MLVGGGIRCLELVFGLPKGQDIPFEKNWKSFANSDSYSEFKSFYDISELRVKF